MDKKGFTLIELLIVVAIIAILAAIAVPNFLEAQVRSKVSRQRANMRSVATALESYFTDQNHYPPTTYNGVNGTWTLPETWKVLPGRMTTPVAYITGNDSLEDVFRRAHKFVNPLCYQIMYLPSFFYLPPYSPSSTSYAAQCNRYGLWTIRSAGPDTYYQNYFHMKGDYDNGGWFRGAYDPSNGTVSAGDIYRSQKRADESHTG